MRRGRKSKIFKDEAKQVTLHQLCKRTRSGMPKVRSNPVKDNDESTSNLQRYSRSVSNPKTIEKSGSKKARNSGASESQ